METHIDPVTYRVDKSFDYEAHMERYPLRLAGIPLADYLAVKVDEGELSEAA